MFLVIIKATRYYDITMLTSDQQNCVTQVFDLSLVEGQIFARNQIMTSCSQDSLEHKDVSCKNVHRKASKLKEVIKRVELKIETSDSHSHVN